MINLHDPIVEIVLCAVVALLTICALTIHSGVKWMIDELGG